MTGRYKIAVDEMLEAQGVPLIGFRAIITFRWIPEYGDGWNEPREPAHPRFISVRHDAGPEIPDADLSEWAEVWVDNHYEACRDVVEAETADAEERRAEERADLAREDRP